MTQPQMTAWAREGNTAWGPCPNRSFTPDERLQAGLYKFQPTMTGWLLDRIGDRFEFPFKVYGTEDELIRRVQRAWAALPQNIGVLLNGLKGTGKTVTAQLLANWAVDNGMVVLLVRDPIPLDVVLAALHQDVVVIFDEFEKTHRKNDDGVNHQEALLTTMDGLSRGLHRRLFVLTTNSRAIDPNLVDRPSRIRYSKEYTRVSDDVVFEVIDDILPAHLAHLRLDIATYIFTRDVLSIDVVKTVIQECVAFEEPPDKFAHMLNLSARTPTCFVVTLVRDDGTEDVLLRDFTTHPSAADALAAALTPSRRQLVDDNKRDQGSGLDTNGMAYLKLKRPVPDTTDLWYALVGVPVAATWLGKHAERLKYGERAWVFYAHEPEGFVQPTFEPGKKGRAPAAFTEMVDERAMYPGVSASEVVVRVEPKYILADNLMKQMA